MKRLLAIAGGQPAKNEDFQLYTQAFDILEGMFQDIGLGDCIISGCGVTEGPPGFYTFDSGIIWFNNTLHIFDGASGTSSSLTLASDTVSAGLRTFDDGNSKYTSEIYKMVEDAGGAFTLSASTLRSKEEFFGPGFTKKKILEIGDWDMDTDGEVFIAHGLTATNIRSVKVSIRSDSTGTSAGWVFDFISPSFDGGTGDGGNLGWDATEVYLSRGAGTFFDNSNFNETSYNRGYIEITYVD